MITSWTYKAASILLISSTILIIFALFLINLSPSKSTTCNPKACAKVRCEEGYKLFEDPTGCTCPECLCPIYVCPFIPTNCGPNGTIYQPSCGCATCVYTST